MSGAETRVRNFYRGVIEDDSVRVSLPTPLHQREVDPGDAQRGDEENQHLSWQEEADETHLPCVRIPDREQRHTEPAPYRTGEKCDDVVVIVEGLLHHARKSALGPQERV